MTLQAIRITVIRRIIACVNTVLRHVVHHRPQATVSTTFRMIAYLTWPPPSSTPLLLKNTALAYTTS
ncbi:hypothetical protein VTO58DRAFT_102660 [Aureobasidium pullulans]